MTRWEREVVDTFREAGWGVMRAPGSGAATPAAVADVVFGHPKAGLTWLGVAELKKRSRPRAYYDADEVDQLVDVAVAFGANAYLGARFDRSIDTNDRVTYLIPVHAAERTDSGKYRVHADDALDRATYVVDATAGEVKSI